MRTDCRAALLLAAICLNSPAPAFADSYTVTFKSGFTAFAYQLDNGVNTLNSIFPGAGEGDQIIKWDVAAQAYVSPHYMSVDGKWYDADTGDPVGDNVKLAVGEGVFFFHDSAVFDYQRTFMGNRVTEAPANINPYPPISKWYFIGRQVPSTGTLDQIVQRPLPDDGISLAVFDSSNGTFKMYFYKSGRWVPNQPIASIAQAVWIGPGPGCGCSGGPTGMTNLALLDGHAFQANAAPSDCTTVLRPLPNALVKCGALQTFTDTNGYFFFGVPPGSYSVTMPAPGCLVQKCPPSDSYAVNPTVGEHIGSLDFGSRVPAGATPDLYVRLYATYANTNGHQYTKPCCGQAIHYHLFYGNKCATASGATLVFTLPNHVSYTSERSVPDISPAVHGLNSLKWTLPVLGPLASGSVDLVVTLDPCSTLGSLSPPLDSTLTISAGASAASLMHKTIVLCSFDPNDKEVAPRGCGVEGFIAGDQGLTYQVHFQNVGSGPASSVVVHDVLDGALDIATLEQLGSSDNYVFLMNGREMIWTYPNINLVPAAVDEPASHGFLQYRVRPLAGLPVGTVITNQAAIYFDENPAVLTPTTTNTITTNPIPVAAFTVSNRQGSAGRTNDFTYTGGTVGASFAWDFGPGASPPTSSDMNPTGIVLPEGAYNIDLQVSLAGCVSASAAKTLVAGLPVLNATLSGSQVCLTWQGQGYSLQQTDNLTSSASWQTIQPPISVVGELNITCLTITNTFKSYRLIN